ncbi:DUF262 domain-containing protein [Marispirochaeta sp.]|uniref:DUF262 domain-containing protein n=1 Tax=Marispirochaeta sp. TaxID=2038653 RepID=UPI0029C85E7B|nr:DUF262 domain-containing protein [Marispirochaeta sp.]
MSYIETNPVKNSTIMLIYSEKEEICIDPSYQRMGGVWTLEKKQLLIDSILNDYDIPKLYFHSYSRDKKVETGLNYAVIDGRQRLEAIWDFIEGKFTLSSDFEYQKDLEIKLSGLSYDDISKEYPKIKIKYDSFVLPIIAVDTDDEDLIEDMFSRLNEAVPLNAAEKRNSIGGDLVDSIRKLAEHDLFANCVKFSNRRFQHREVAARFLLIEQNLLINNKLIDTKKIYLDALARNFHSNKSSEVKRIYNSCQHVLNSMVSVFTNNDELLKAQGNMVIYYLIFKFALDNNELHLITRRKLIDFLESLRENRTLAEKDYESSSFDLLEYDRLTQQGTNDSSNIKERYNILSSILGLSNHEF